MRPENFGSGLDPNCLILMIFLKDFFEKFNLTLVLLSQDIPCFANSVDPDQLASEEAN